MAAIPLQLGNRSRRLTIFDPTCSAGAKVTHSPRSETALGPDHMHSTTSLDHLGVVSALAPCAYSEKLEF